MQNKYKKAHKTLQHERSRSVDFLSVELLLVRLHVDTTLELSTGSADLEAGNAVGRGLVELFQALDAGVLHGVLETGGQVGDELANGTVKYMLVECCEGEEKGKYVKTYPR